MPLAKPREKDRDRDVESPKKDTKDSKDRPRHKSSRSARKVEKASTPPERSSRPSSPTRTKPRRSSLPVPDLERTNSSSPSGSKNRLPYPEFSKAHSKEAVGSRENVATDQEKPALKMRYFTPDPTDLSKEQDNNTKYDVRNKKNVAPPSPPETTLDEDIKVEKKKGEKVRFERKRTDLEKAAEELKRKLSRESAKISEAGKERQSRESKSRRDSVKDTGQEKTKSVQSPKTSKPGTPSKLKARVGILEDAMSNTSSQKPSSLRSGSGKSEAPTISTDSDATSIAPNQPNTQRPFTPVANRDSSPATEPDSPGPRTPVASDVPSSRKETPAFSVTDSRAPSIANESPMPPPPPPPPSEIPAPKVDYLIQNGGLSHTVTRSLLAAGIQTPPGQPPPAMNTQVELLFLPFNKVLDDYSKVITRNGSLAVATGYRSVARRLLERVERVFARDLSAETCECDLCSKVPETDQQLDDKRGVSWGEILEYVCGRQDLPAWPPFSFVDGVGLGISPAEQATPMQKLDIDVPEEFREHYVRQSRKTKQSVDQWLDSQNTESTAPSQDFDDETLTFAMLTRLEPNQRPFFTSFLGVTPVASRPASTAPLNAASPSLLSPQSSLLQKTALALQRLYRLPTPPRDPESAMYLLTNPSIHNVLATLAAVSDHEWDLLISGRFDGFLRSGADDDYNNSTPIPSTTPSNTLPSRVPSRNQSSSTTPGKNLVTPSIPSSRGPASSSTPLNPNIKSSSSPSSAASGAPVALDEETEIAALAELERDIYLGMEALEDAFEALHTKAETVRRLLRERGAGLACASQSRYNNGNAAALGADDVRMATPASQWESETDDGIGDDSESLAPDDSASNVSRSRMRRPKRRTERRTPAPVEEEDEDEDEVVRVVSGGRVSRGGDERGGVGRSGGSRLGKWFGGVS